MSALFFSSVAMCMLQLCEIGNPHLSKLIIMLEEHPDIFDMLSR